MESRAEIRADKKNGIHQGTLFGGYEGDASSPVNIGVGAGIKGLIADR
jgi:hypothetical protein